jgi:hypothetical protein
MIFQHSLLLGVGSTMRISCPDSVQQARRHCDNKERTLCEKRPL